jgi:hypothetical protein
VLPESRFERFCVGLSPATSVVVPARVACHMTGLPTDSSNFSGSLTSPIYLEQPRTFADCCLASACNLRPCPNTSEPRCASTRLFNGQNASWKVLVTTQDSGTTILRFHGCSMFSSRLRTVSRPNVLAISNVRHFSQYWLK